MEQTETNSSRSFPIGSVVSPVLHAIVIYLLIFGLPKFHMEVDPPEAIQVQLVQPEEIESEDEEPPAPEPVEEPEPEAEEPATAAVPERQPERVLNPVFQFGQEDSGPGIDASSDELDGSETAEEERTQETQEESETVELAEETLATLGPEATPEPVPETEPEAAPETDNATRSIEDTATDIATTAMADIPRGVRAGELCVSELRRQLLGSAHPPRRLPEYRLDQGTVLQVRRGAFQSGAQWYNLQFRCEIDEDATRVVTFEYDVGSAIPKEEWAARGFPES